MVLGDVEGCAELFLEAHGKGCGWDRRADITGCLGSGAPFPMLVARDADGKVVGYTTGFYIVGHTVAKSQDIFCDMFRESSKLHQQAGLPCPRFHTRRVHGPLVVGLGTERAQDFPGDDPHGQRALRAHPVAGRHRARRGPKRQRILKKN